MESMMNLINRAKTFLIQKAMVSAMYLYFQYNLSSPEDKMVSLDILEAFLRQQLRLWEVKEVLLTKILEETPRRRISIKVHISLERKAKFRSSLLNFGNLQPEWSPMQQNRFKTEERKRQIYLNYIDSLYNDQFILLEKNYRYL